MALKSFPNNRDEYVYAQDAMKWLFPRTQGVFGAGENLAVKPLASPGMSIQITDGLAWMKDAEGNGCACWNDTYKQTGANLVVAVPAASTTQNRIDRVVLSWNTAGYVELPEIKIITGTPASSPVAPAITNNGSTRQISLAKISVPANASSVTASMITDERLNASVCGIVTEAVEIDTSVMESQFAELLLIYQSAIQSSIEGTVPPHAFTHRADGSDPLTAEDVGAVAAEERISRSGAVNLTLAENKKYSFTNVSSLTMNVSTVKARGFITFASSFSAPKITAKAKAGDDITEAAAKETWEFDTEDGFVIFKNWGVV